MAATERTWRRRLFLFLSVCVLKGDGRYIEDNDVLKDELYSFFNSEPRGETTQQELIVYRRPLRCVDMAAAEGRFTFSAEHPQLNCAAFFVAEPDEVVGVELDGVDVDCQAGDFVTVFDGWVMNGEKFPSSQDHPLGPRERYVNYCDPATSARTSVRSSQNVAMIFFRVHNAGSGFTVTFRKLANPSPCNIISQSPRGTFTMVTPQQRRNCSFSVVYPAEVDVHEFSSLGLRGNFPKWPTSECASDSEDVVQLLGGNGLDTSKMLPVKELCSASAGSSHAKVGCDNTVVRLVSSGRYVNKVSFSYRSLDGQELQRLRVNNVEDFCFPN
ncbi:corticotropin-releasing factor-binding protein-like [Syngnathoides biaculeatus]|uniref:corticotropin-releasing factor-binding protein-like n=1 Tax=Syngnathoides biaculeatus TaxID=300417 RepID=UPI002ADE8973|nr:corticotropin-releasing factor-binding protein-like [Syngnathoides biaculeatus]